MITLFEVITHYGTSDPKILAGGISEALITTQAGLSIAIPILLIHNFLRNQSLHIHAEMEKHAVRILNRLWPET
jgi:biopolymer transport protein ExbB